MPKSSAGQGGGRASLSHAVTGLGTSRDLDEVALYAEESPKSEVPDLLA